jgi:hypothetical protein
MWPFKKKKEQTLVICNHEWIVTESIHTTIRGRYIDDPDNMTRVSRICKKCLLKEQHYVDGHIDYSKALTIFGGKEE